MLFNPGLTPLYAYLPGSNTQFMLLDHKGADPNCLKSRLKEVTPDNRRHCKAAVAIWKLP